MLKVEMDPLGDLIIAMALQGLDEPSGLKKVLFSPRAFPLHSKTRRCDWSTCIPGIAKCECYD